MYYIRSAGILYVEMKGGNNWRDKGNMMISTRFLAGKEPRKVGDWYDGAAAALQLSGNRYTVHGASFSCRNTNGRRDPLQPLG